ncbi:hypothetical protein [Streptomyces violaceusniger]|uniref:Uncharacterized protein n=1 Tax=Streptomyces violaceusniger TaxID=68280 RepID=A0A4D4LF11_STRVO|nr:hypothetical protein SVIO_102580 [Streptomyces violaceusniger]
MTDHNDATDVLAVARIQGQWHAWSAALDEWLPIPLTAEATDRDVEQFYAARGISIRMAESRHTG